MSEEVKVTQIYAHYEPDGTIVALLEGEPVGAAGPVVVAPPGSPIEVVLLELDDEARGLEHGELMARYRIDPKTRGLVKR
jgi:hypothetical protein